MHQCVHMCSPCTQMGSVFPLEESGVIRLVDVNGKDGSWGLGFEWLQRALDWGVERKGVMAGPTGRHGVQSMLWRREERRSPVLQDEWSLLNSTDQRLLHFYVKLSYCSFHRRWFKLHWWYDLALVYFTLLANCWSTDSKRTTLGSVSAVTETCSIKLSPHLSLNLFNWFIIFISYDYCRFLLHYMTFWHKWHANQQLPDTFFFFYSNDTLKRHKDNKHNSQITRVVMHTTISEEHKSYQNLPCSLLKLPHL